jgi:hypothetical protein
MRIRDLKEILSQYDDELLINKFEITKDTINIQCIRPVEFIKIEIKFDNRAED